MEEQNEKRRQNNGQRLGQADKARTKASLHKKVQTKEQKHLLTLSREW